ncbi:MAG TPA: DEAD/DEAH box helicase [Chitinophagaceae bacterium]|nr:DEAD/DEAH box helicase [Chitinophagaceae bacterium]
MKFEKYSIAKELKQSLAELNFVKTTDIQYKAIPSILSGEDVMAVAQTGTGKTAAYAIPVIEKLLKKISKKNQEIFIKCLVLVPTRELALQVTEVFKKLSVYTPVEVLSTFGGVSQNEQIEELEFGVDILVSTPGRLFDLRSQGYIQLNHVEIFVLDEADKMLALGFMKDIQDIIKFLPKRHQTLFFSATINPHIKSLAYELVKNAIRIQISPKDPVSKNVIHSLVKVEMDDKRFFLERVIREHLNEKILIFVRTKVRAERVQKAMKRVEINTITLHGDKTQDERFEALQQFKDNECRILIATDLSARGIDIPKVNLVINYDVPDIAENYVHRVGRTGRGMDKGIAITFCAKEEQELLNDIIAFIGYPIQEIKMTNQEYSMVQLFAEESKNDWKKLIEEEEKSKLKLKKKNKKK